MRFFGGGSPFAAFSAAYASLARRRCTIHGLLLAPVLVCGIYIYAPRVCAGNPGRPQFELRLSAPPEALSVVRVQAGLAPKENFLELWSFRGRSNPRPSSV